MKKLIGYTLAIFISYNVSAQKIVDKSPLNQEFVDFINFSKSKGIKKTNNGYSTGFVPSPLKINFNDIDIKRESKKSSLVTLPAKFDQRDSGWITPVRNQGPLGACWSFATMGALETRFIRLGRATRLNIDLSEMNMATCHGFEAGINDGGSDFIALAYLTRLSGPVTEASDPYNTNPNAVCGNGPFVIPAYSPISRWLPNDINVIKKIIRDYGAVTSSIQMGNYTPYYNSSDYTYYYNGTAPVDHGVLIVGWDDNKVVTGGLLSPKGTVGAWIVKNSWGTPFGESGFFYVSYKDTKFNNSVAIYPDILDKSEIDTLYMNDWLGATSSFGFRQETGYVVEKFIAPKEHFIRKIGTFINSSGTVIDIDIYDDFQEDSLLTNLIASSHGNVVLFPGYETFDIPATVNGDYYVKIKYFTPGFNYPIPVETQITYLGETYAIPTINPSGTGWISYNGINWNALGNNIPDNEADLCIRVYADKNTDLNAYFNVNKTTTCINSPVTFTQASNGNVDTFNWNFGKDAIPATANTSGPHNVSYSSTGKKIVSLTITGPLGTRTLTKNNYVEVVDQLEIFLPYSEKNLVKGKSLPITAFGADNYSWSPPTGLNVTSGASVIANPVNTIIYTVNGSTGTCIGSTTIKINVLENPPNDNVCDAIMLTSGFNGPFTNVNSTVEPNEPLPDTTDCNTQHSWCDQEGGLQSSVWFSFIANSNSSSFTSKGMDTQIALYDAATCAAILSGSYTILAANDDYFGQSLKFAAALENIPLVPGKTYFLQMDGSGGGEEGSFTIEIWNADVGESEFKISKLSEFNVFPNPTNGLIRLYMKEAPETFTISIIDITGKTILNDVITSHSGIFDKQYFIPEKGLYLIKLIGEDVNYSRKVIRDH